MNKTSLLLTALVSASALAEEATPPPPPPPAPAAATATAPADAPVATETDPGGRVRWGIGAGAGMHFGIPYPVFGMQLKGRVGYQITNLFGAYLDIGGDFGVGGQVTASQMGGSASATGLGHFFVQALAEIILADLFYVAGGGGIAYGGLGILGVDASANSGGIGAIAQGGVSPAFDVKLGLAFGKPKPGSFRRGGFNLGIDAQMVLHTNATVARLQGDGMGGSVTVNVNESVFTITPMLTLGYDAR
jgi:hypothetical protein